MKLIITAALFAAFVSCTLSAPTGEEKKSDQKVPSNANVQTALKVLPSIDAKQVVVGLIEREDFEGSVADEAARARSATREGRKIVVPPEITITSGTLRVEGDTHPQRKGRIIEVGRDGIPVVHGVREPDDENDGQVWRNAVVIGGKLYPGSVMKAGRSLELEDAEEKKEDHPPARRIQPRILTGGDVHVIEAVPVEERQDSNGSELDSKDNTNSDQTAGQDNQYDASNQYVSNHRYLTQSHQGQPTYSGGEKPKAVGSVEVIDLEPGYSSTKREFTQVPKKKKNRKQQQQQKAQQQQQAYSRDDVALDAQDAYNPEYFNQFNQGNVNGYETNFLLSSGDHNGVDDSQDPEQSDPNVHPESQFQFSQSRPQKQQRPVQIQQGPAPQAGQVLPNGGVVIGPANPNDFVVHHINYDNGFSIPVPVPAGQLSGVKTDFLYEDPTSDAISEELFGQEPQQPQRPFGRPPQRRPVVRDQPQFGNGPVRRPQFPSQGLGGRPQFIHSHSRPGRPGSFQPQEVEGAFNRMRQNVRQSVRRHYQQFQDFINPVAGPLRQAGKQITQNLGLADSLGNLNERLTTVVGVPGLPAVLGGALALGALGLGAHALNNFEISVNRGGRKPDGEKSAKTAATASVVSAIEAATKAYSKDSTITEKPTESTSTTTEKTSDKPEMKSGRQAKVLKLEDMQLRRRRRAATPNDDPDFFSNMLEMVQSPDAVYYAKMGDDYATRKRSPCVGKIGCRVTSVIYPTIERDFADSDEIVPARAPRDIPEQLEQ